MKTSARNKFDGKITRIEPLGILTDVELTTKDGLVIKAQITEESRKALELKDGKHCSAIIKAPLVQISTAKICRKKVANCFAGVIDKINSDEHAVEVIGSLSGDHRICAIFANGEAPENIKEGDTVHFCFGSSMVIIAD